MAKAAKECCKCDVDVTSLRILALEVANVMDVRRRYISKSKCLNGKVFIHTDPRYAGRLDDSQGSQTTRQMEQVRKIMTVNQEMKNE